MRLALCSSLLAAVAIASPFVRRATDANTTAVLADISKLNNDTIALNNTLNTFSPNSVLGFYTVQLILVQATLISTDLQNAAGAVNSSSPFTDVQSFTIAMSLLSFLPNFYSLLSNIVTHKPAFATVYYWADFSKTVQKGLVQQQELSREFSSALQSRFSPALAVYVPGIEAQINGTFTKAIAAYQACNGYVCLPPVF